MEQAGNYGGWVIFDAGIATMNLNQVKTFESVARHLNMTRAAEELHVSQSAVSQQIRLLEEQNGRTFFRRVGKRLELTELGRAYLDAVKPILIQIESVERSLTVKSNAREADVLAIGATHGFCINVLPEILASFKHAHPWVRVLLEANDNRVLEQRVLNAELEMALTTDPGRSPHIELQPYKKLKPVATISAASPLARTKFAMGDLLNVPLVVRKEGKIEKMLAEQGYDSNIVVRCENSEAVKAAAQMGIGVGVLYRNVVEREVMRGELKIINVPELKKMEFQSFIICDRRRPLSLVAREFLQTLRARKDSKTPSTDKLGLLKTG